MGVNTDTNKDEQQADTDAARLIREGDEYLRQSRGTEAESCFRKAVECCPHDSRALHRLGFVVFLRGDTHEAVELLLQSASRRGDDPTLCGHLASALMASGRLHEAIESWQRAVELAPDYAAAYEKLGDAHLANGDTEASEAAYRKSIELLPDGARALVGLGRMLYFSDRNQEAEDALRRALELGQGAADIGILVGTVLLEVGGLDAALELFDAAVNAEPDEAQGHASRGLALHWLGRLDEAESAYRRALNHDSRSQLALKHLGVLLQERNQLGGAAECFKNLLEVNPNDDVARHMLAATSGKSPSSAPAGYVTRLFDDYADRFDAHLGSIDYHAPTLMRDAVLAIAGGKALAWRILDLGCGTGLCGEAVRPIASFLIGVDLSARMIAKARERKIYDSLMVGKIEDALEGEEQSLDLIIAGDVFTYVGDLGDVFAGCASALRTGALMAFSIESTTNGTYQLCPTGRYAHSSQYVNATADASGLSVVNRQDITVRNDPVPIPGEIVVLSKRA